MCQRTSFTTNRRAFTLSELLVVITIIALLIGLSVPAILPALKDRKLREASRQINGYVAGAQSRAAALGRPVGIWLERDDGNNQASIQVFMAEVAAPYMGDVVDARVVIDLGTATNPGFNTNDNGLGAAGWAYLPANHGISLNIQGFVQAGDLIKFDYRGPDYRITAAPVQVTDPPNVPPGQYWQIAFSHPSAPPPRSSLAGVPFQITRTPFKSNVTSIELPVEMCIDLSLSGWSSNEFAAASANDRNPVVIMFAPDGSVDEVFFSVLDPSTNLPISVRAAPHSQIHLFIGKHENAGDLTNFANMLVTNHFWISFGPSAGTVSTVENADISNVDVSNLSPQQAWLKRLYAARQFARQKQMSGGQ